MKHISDQNTIKIKWLNRKRGVNDEHEYLDSVCFSDHNNFSDTSNCKEDISAGSLFKSSYIVTALNPKGIAFFVAFFPQFIQPHEPVLNQLVLLSGTFLSLAIINAALHALFASQIRETIRKGNVLKWFNRCGGTALIGAGIFTSTMKRSA